MIELAFALAVTGAATIFDLRTRTLPDWLTIGAAGVGTGVHVMGAALGGARGIDLLASLGGSAVGAIACSFLPLLFVKKSAMGGGDLKLFIALGALLGPIAGIEAQVYALAAALVAAPFVAWRAGRMKEALATAWAVLVGKKKDASDEPEAAFMPFAPAILAGVVLSLVTSLK